MLDDEPRNLWDLAPAGYTPPSTKVIPPAPPEYRANFEKGGWRLVERLYGARTDLHLKWQAMTGCESRRKRA